MQESIAVTQNYASSANLKHVLAFLKDSRTEMVSGCPFEQRGHLHDAFVAALRQKRPKVRVARQAACNTYYFCGTKVHVTIWRCQHVSTLYLTYDTIQRWLAAQLANQLLMCLAF